jgi:hypothetical protein
MPAHKDNGKSALVSTHKGQETCTYVGNVDVWLLYDEAANSWINLGQEAETPITEDEAEQMGFQLVAHKDNPKLVLDDGRVYYGCQVCWSTEGARSLSFERFLLSISQGDSSE